MAIYNSEIAEKFNKIADLLEIAGENEFRARSYRNAARIVSRESGSFEEMVKNDKDLTNYKGIGKDLAGQIKEIVKTGESRQLKKLKSEMPETLLKILKIEGLGPKSVEKLHEVLDIDTVEELKKAAENSEVSGLEGFGKKTIEKILQSIKKMEENDEDRTLLKNAEEFVTPVMSYLEASGLAEKIAVAGSYRRRNETVGDIDLLATSSQSTKLIEHFADFNDVEKVVSKGETKSTVTLRTGMQIDLRVVDDEDYGAALMYFTGSKSHNIALREIALNRNWKLSEYGLFDDNENKIASTTENEVYGKLGLDFIPPELRENRGEISAAKKSELPELLDDDDIKGDLQMHTQHSDGQHSIKEIAKEAQKLGREYIAITDHSSYVGITQGLDESDVEEYINRVRKTDGEVKGIRIIAGIEVDLLEDGTLDLSDEYLEKFDIVLFSVHSKFDLGKNKQTERIIKGMENPQTKIFAHPSGRLIGEREGYQLEWDKIFSSAKENGCFLEINANPKRLDLDDLQIKSALEKGLKLAVSTDAHSKEELQFLRYGVNQARRGWVGKKDVINTLSYHDLKKELEF